MASPAEIDALTIASAFLIASLSIILVLYNLQWNYFNSKGMLRPRKDQIRLKDKSADEAQDAFVLEIAYILFALMALFLNASALLGFGPPASALQVSLLLGVFFFIVVYREFATSLSHLRRRNYAKPLWDPVRIRIEPPWWQLSTWPLMRFRRWLLRKRIRKLWK